MSLQVNYNILTNKGLIRTTNEDIIEAGVMDKLDTTGGHIALKYILICDGIGGMKAGETASRLASITLLDYIKAMPFWPSLESDIQNQMYLATLAAHQNIKMLSEYDYDKNDMGTTLVLLIIVENSAYITWSGDSRAYLLTEYPKHQTGLYQDGLILLTKDHVFAWNMIENCMLTLDQLRNHPQANILLQSLGGKDAPRPEFIAFQVYDRDRILLCSDGVNLHLDTKDINEILNSEIDTTSAVNAISDLVIKKGAKDNFSIGIMDILGVKWSQPDLTTHKVLKRSNVYNSLKWSWLIPIGFLAYYGLKQYSANHDMQKMQLITSNQTTIMYTDIDKKKTNDINFQNNLIESIQRLNIAVDSLNNINLQRAQYTLVNENFASIMDESLKIKKVKLSLPQITSKAISKPVKKVDHNEKIKLYDEIYNKAQALFDEIKIEHPNPDSYINSYLIRLEKLLYEINQKKNENEFTDLTKTQRQIKYLKNKFEMIQTEYQPK